MSTVSGACVRRARFAAALGSPIPTKQEAPLRIMRAAAMVIISSAVYLRSDMAYRLFQTALELIKIPGAQDVLLHPCQEGLALARDWVPLLIEGIITRIIALRVGRKRPTFHFAHSPDYPGRQNDGVRRRVKIVDDLFDGDDDAFGSQ